MSRALFHRRTQVEIRDALSLFALSPKIQLYDLTLYEAEQTQRDVEVDDRLTVTLSFLGTMPLVAVLLICCGLGLN